MASNRLGILLRILLHILHMFNKMHFFFRTKLSSQLGDTAFIDSRILRISV